MSLKMMKLAPVGVLPLLTACSLGFVPAMVAAPSLSLLPEGVRLIVDGNTIHPEQYGELLVNIDYLPSSPNTMSIYTHFVHRRAPEDHYSLNLSFDRKFGLDFPSEFDQGSLEPAHCAFIHPGEKAATKSGNVSQLEAVPPGMNVGFLGPMAGKMTTFWLKVGEGRIRGIFEAPFEFPQTVGGSGKIHSVRLELNIPFEPETSA